MTQATAPGARIEALDFVRGCALFGILLMNIVGFGLAGAYVNPTNSGGATGANLGAWMITQIGFEGTQRALFSMLFGAGVVLFTTHAEAAGRGDATELFVRRTLWLLAFGMFDAFVLLWHGDILYAYGLTGLFVVAFRKLGVKALLAIGVAGLLFGALLSLADARRTIGAEAAYRALPAAAKADGAEPTPAQAKAIEAWEKARGGYVAEPGEVDEKVASVRAGYASAWAMWREENVYFQTVFMYRYFFDVFAMMLIGMALLKSGVLTLEAPSRLYWTMMLGGYAVGLTTNILETRWIIAHGFSAIAFAQADVSYELGRLATAAGHLGALLLFCRSGALGWLRRSMAAVGRMALTNYLTHAVVCLLLFVGLGWYGQLERHQLYYVVFVIWAAQLVLSPIWLRHYRFGPVEWLWRWLTYLERPPFRLRAGDLTCSDMPHPNPSPEGEGLREGRRV